ncbi:DUF7344 domain-containing protein [Haloarcula litorea]|uniref:DUF7344 domain-containing protein n=1 Tax=Haloarcula litorea TaxID=3032579 RepID=UPI0023E8D901|nr:hypothetical protein [Halomicroarcula sp. GDY20]
MSNTKLDRSHRGGALDHLPATERHELLSSARRRVAVRVLTARDGSITLESLARSITAHEETNADDESVRAVSISLHHCHLPKLDEAAVVDYDADANDVRLTDEA